MLLAVLVAGAPRTALAQEGPEGYDGAVTVTYTPLVDVHACLTREDQYKRIRAKYPKAAPLLLTFVEDYVQPKMNVSVAFLAVDYAHSSATFKLANDPDGVVDDLKAWKGHTSQVAFLLDAFLRGQAELENARVAVSSGSRTVLEGWELIERYSSDELTSTAQIAGLVSAFKTFAATDEGKRQLKALRKQDRNLHRQIKRLVIGTSVRELESLQTFEPQPRTRTRFIRKLPRLPPPDLPAP